MDEFRRLSTEPGWSRPAPQAVANDVPEIEQLTERDGVYFAISEKPGRATAAVLADAIPAVVRAFPWPKSMRWGDASVTTDSLRWVKRASPVTTRPRSSRLASSFGAATSSFSLAPTATWRTSISSTSTFM